MLHVCAQAGLVRLNISYDTAKIGVEGNRASHRGAGN